MVNLERMDPAPVLPPASSCQFITNKLCTLKAHNYEPFAAKTTISSHPITMAKSPKKTPSTPPANPYGPMVRFSYGSALKKKPKNTANTNTIQSVETGVPGIIIHFGTRPDKVCSYIWPFKNYHEQYAEIEDLIRKWGCNGKFLFVLCTYCRFGCIYLISFIYHHPHRLCHAEISDR